MLQACRNSALAILQYRARYLWGWLQVIINRLNYVDTSIILVSISDAHIDGINDIDTIKELPKAYRGCVWTDSIEQVGLL